MTAREIHELASLLTAFFLCFRLNCCECVCKNVTIIDERHINEEDFIDNERCMLLRTLVTSKRTFVFISD